MECIQGSLCPDFLDKANHRVHQDDGQDDARIQVLTKEQCDGRRCQQHVHQRIVELPREFPEDPPAA